MAEVKLYKCKECGFSVSSEGPSSRGMMYQCKCFKCEECGHIGDSTTATLIGEYASGPEEWKEITPKCRECKSTNIHEWDFKCPTCKAKLKGVGTGLMQD